MRNIKKVIEEHITRNIRTYFILIIIFLLGLIIGLIVVNNSSEEQETEITNYINTFITELKNGSKLDYFKLLKSSFGNNLFLVIILWFMSLAVIGIPAVYGMVGYKGFCMGYTISSIVMTLGTGKGIVFVLSSMLVHNIILIPCMLAVAVSGINLYKSIIKDRKKENIKIEIIRHTLFCLIMLVVMAVGSLIETYISSNLLVSVVSYL